MTKKVVQVLLSEAEHELIAAAATCRGKTHVARKARTLLIEWALGTLEVRGGTRGGVCGSSSGCTNAPANYFNTNALFWCCESCANWMREHTGSTAVCVVPGDIERVMRTYVAATDAKRIVEAVRAQTGRRVEMSREELVEALVSAGRAVAEYDKSVGAGDTGNGNRGNNGSNGLFDTLMHRFQD